MRFFFDGLSSVLSFLPPILTLFLFFSILEDSGYMARIAFIIDRMFRRFGLSGRAFMPMIMGFGCSVPAIINTRTLADEKERTATIRVIPFFSCGAKLPILAAVAGAIVYTIGSWGWTFFIWLVVIALVVIGIVLCQQKTVLRTVRLLRGVRGRNALAGKCFLAPAGADLPLRSLVLTHPFYCQIALLHKCESALPTKNSPTDCKTASWRSWAESNRRHSA